MKTLKWGLVGAGDIVRKRIAPALRESSLCELVAVSRGRAELAASFAAEFGIQKWFADWSDLVADDEIEAVYIATPVYLHAAQTLAAVAAGKHVLCEKPMAMTIDECDRMIAAARARGVKLGVAYYRRFYPVVGRVRELLAAGAIGAVSVAQINAFEYFDPAPDHPRRWLVERGKSGGGPMMDFGCHRLELLLHLFGAPRKIKSVVANAVFAREVEDTAVALLEFASGVCATVTVTHAAAEPQDTLDIFGTKGSIHIPVLNRGEIRIRVGQDERIEAHPPAANTHRPLIEDFTEAVLSGRNPSADDERGRLVSLLEEEIYRRGG